MIKNLLFLLIILAAFSIVGRMEMEDEQLYRSDQAVNELMGYDR